MLIAENTRRSRLPVLYGILAKSALSQFDTQPPNVRRSAYFQNLITLLEMYRYGTLRQPSHRAVLDRREITKATNRFMRIALRQPQAPLSALPRETFLFAKSDVSQSQHEAGSLLSAVTKSVTRLPRDMRREKISLNLAPY